MNISDFLETITPYDDKTHGLGEAVDLIKDNMGKRGITRIMTDRGVLAYNFNIGLPAFFSPVVLGAIETQGNIGLSQNVGLQVKMVWEHLLENPDIKRADHVMLGMTQDAGIGLHSLFEIPEMFAVENNPIINALVPTLKEWASYISKNETLTARGTYYNTVVGYNLHTTSGMVQQVTQITEMGGEQHHNFILNPWGMPIIPQDLYLTVPDFSHPFFTDENEPMQFPEKRVRLNQYGYDWATDYVERVFQLKEGTFRDRGKFHKKGQKWWSVYDVHPVEILFQPFTWPHYINYISKELKLRKNKIIT